MYLFIDAGYPVNVTACISYDATETPLLNAQWEVSNKCTTSSVSKNQYLNQRQRVYSVSVLMLICLICHRILELLEQLFLCLYFIQSMGGLRRLLLHHTKAPTLLLMLLCLMFSMALIFQCKSQYAVILQHQGEVKRS